MNKRTAVVIIGISFILAFILGPPDFASMFILGFESAILCGLLVFTITRLKSFLTTGEKLKIFILALVCLLSVVVVHLINYILYYVYGQKFT